ncbi:hypothetical protein [Mycolicibacter longobardus]|uniref:Transmembrane protein n=1 Tax=Mycolicibacter longobardus TaxID=1108812 RepID=A0A1X1YI86_9MYCO|nr:hypothetical protein [Mycolicibacter longobardus]MCV7385916.1 hypothetical protein [Mycolicibacter longobardus]ORW10764.1 hypothetical protein AWC16_13630 [Mycolicibacter longobardus]
MTRSRPGWLIALCAATLSASAWLPWLSTSANGGGHASAIGGSFGAIALPPRFGIGQLIVLLAAVLLVAGAMIGRELFSRLASVAALVISLLIGALGFWYYQLNVVAPIAAAYGMYVGAVAVAGALGCSIWALVSAVRR